MQKEVFLESEGDAWFNRNAERIEAAQNSWHEIITMERVLKPFTNQINQILEIGCGNGAKLNNLCNALNATGFGVDPSNKAISSGRQSYPDLKLYQSTADSLPLPDSSIDLVLFGFCLYLVDRESLFRAIAEADRVCRKGGFLAILDFDSPGRMRRPYSHLSGLFSFKNSYSSFFEAGGHYHLVSKDSFSHQSDFFSVDVHERISISILYKEPEPYALVEGPFSAT